MTPTATTLLVLAVSLLITISTNAFSSYSTFTRSTLSSNAIILIQNGDNMLMYDSSNDPPNNDNGSSNSNMWTVLATTERWLSNILGQTSAPDNPYTRKEVSYVCEAQADEAMIIANIWRRLREARERGELHGQTEEDRRLEQGEILLVSSLSIYRPCNADSRCSFTNEYNVLPQ